MKGNGANTGGEKGKRIPGWIGLAANKLFDALYVFIAMCMSELIMHNAALGGALYLTGQIWVVYARMTGRRGRKLLPSTITAQAIVVFVGAALLSALLLVFYPRLAYSRELLPLILCIFFLLLRQAGAVLVAWHWAPPQIRLVLLLFWHTLLSVGIMAVLKPRLAEGEFWMLAAMVGGTALLAFCHQIFVIVPDDGSAPDADKLQNVSAFRVYNRMVTSMFVALNLSIFTYICYIRYLPATDMLGAFVSLLIWLVVVGALTALGFLFFKRREVTSRYDKPSMFVAGALLFCVACIGTYNGWFVGLNNLWNNFLWAMGLACMFSVILTLGKDMQAVLEFSLGEEEARDYQANTAAMVEWGLTLSTLLLVLLFTVFTFFVEGKADQVEALLGFGDMLRTMMLLLPPAFLLIALIYALMQPLNKDYARKLMHYRALVRRGEVNPALETRLQVQLSQRTRYILPSILRGLLRPLMPCRVIGKEQVNLSDGPVVFACNHLEVYGPIISNLHLPFYFRSWIVSSMLSREAVAEQLTGGVDKIFRFLPRGIRAKIPGWIAPLVPYVLNLVEPIPVYQGNVREVVKTIRLTVDAMEYEDNILLFPENPEAEGEPGAYKQAGVSQFFSGFSSIGSEYHKRTGCCTTFYPVYINKKKRIMTIGPGVRFDPDNPKTVEKDRIVDALYGWMQEQSSL